jgi:hypothetical protein
MSKAGMDSPIGGVQIPASPGHRCYSAKRWVDEGSERMDGILPWIDQHPALAAWVQAVGSILAIVVAIAVASNQFREAVKRDRNAWASRLKSIAVILRIMVDALQSMYDLQDDPHSEQRTRSLRKAFTLFQTTSLAVSKIPLEDLSSEQFAITLMAALDNIAALQKSLEGALRGEMSPKELAEFKELLDSFSEYDGQLQKEIQRIQSM